MSFKIHYFFWSCFISIGIIYSEHIFWIVCCISFLKITRFKNYLIFIFFFFLILVQQNYPRFKTEHFIYCQDFKCFFKTSFFDNPVVNFKKSNGLYLLKGSLINNKNKLLRPLNEYKVVTIQEIHQISQGLDNHFRRKIKSFFKKDHVRKVYECFFLGVYPKNEKWFDVFKEMSLLHALCLSGMHVNFLYELCLKRKMPFMIMGMFLMFLVDFSFPLTRAFLKKIFDLYKYEKEDAFWWAVFFAFFIKPSSIFSLSFWLTIYFSCLIEYKNVSNWILKIGGLGWGILMGTTLSPFLILLGFLFEPVIYYFLYPLLIIGVPFLFFEKTSIFFGNFLQSFLMIVGRLNIYTDFISVDVSKGIFFIIMPFIFTRTKFKKIPNKLGCFYLKKAL